MVKLSDSETVRFQEIWKHREEISRDEAKFIELGIARCHWHHSDIGNEFFYYVLKSSCNRGD